MRVRLKQDHDFPVPGARAVVAYKAGGEYVVKREWGDSMVAAGVAEEPKAEPIQAEPVAVETPDAN